MKNQNTGWQTRRGELNTILDLWVCIKHNADTFPGGGSNGQEQGVGSENGHGFTSAQAKEGGKIMTWTMTLQNLSHRQWKPKSKTN